MWKKLNVNPLGRNVEDCTVRALATALNIDWDSAHDLLCEASKNMATMPHADEVMSAILRGYGFNRAVIPNTCPDCYDAEDFCMDHPRGVYVLGFGGHVATVIDGVLMDSWDSSGLVPMYYFYRKDGK